MHLTLSKFSPMKYMGEHLLPIHTSAIHKTRYRSLLWSWKISDPPSELNIQEKDLCQAVLWWADGDFTAHSADFPSSLFWLFKLAHVLLTSAFSLCLHGHFLCQQNCDRILYFLIPRILAILISKNSENWGICNPWDLNFKDSQIFCNVSVWRKLVLQSQQISST